MVDGVQFSFYGLIAFATGRGFHAVLALLPMLLGAALGAGAARSLNSMGIGSIHRSGLIARRTVAVVTALALVALTLGLARPASTDPIVDAAGNEIAGSVAELTTVDINGHDLAMMIRGHSTDNPVLLFLAGGPGGTELGAMRRHLPALEEHFTVVTWDQRGAGKSYPELDPAGTITLDGYVDDTIAVTNYLRDRFEQDHIYLLGQSWGTTLGVLAVQQQPELFQAFIGTGQMVSQLESDRLFYTDTLEWARESGNESLVDDLEAIGPPPYEDILNYEIALANEQDVYAYDHSPNSEGSQQMAENLIVKEYALIDQVHALGAFLDTFAALYPQLQDIDFRETATDFGVPMFFVQGANEADGRAELFNDWYPMINAPVKDMTVLNTSGHRPLWEQPDEFVDYMVDTVLATTQSR
jgi:pimeloyl-ACP methyl ester carboxylesterase